jgi:hypothetical protein
MPPTQDAAKRALRELIDQYNLLSDSDRVQMTEASVVRQFIDRLLEEVLGWPIKDPARYEYEMHTQAGRPDMLLKPESGGLIFVEAKRFGVIKELKETRESKDLKRVITPEQMSLPGMATDRTQEEQQAINYAFVNNGEWAILTNFERLRLFNARRDWLVLAFEKPEGYLEHFEELWQLAYHNVLNGSLNALSSQRWTKEVDTDYLAFINEQRLALARDVVANGDLNKWAFHDDGTLNLPLLRSVVQRYLDRLVVVRFAEDQFVIPPGTLRKFYELRKGDRFYTRWLDEYLDDFFFRIDEAHNSALFSKHLADEAMFGDEVLLPLVEELYRARYRSMPADIMGNTYEQYLGKTLALDNGSVATRDNLETRKKQGSYYTPQVIVRYIVDHSLGRYLYGTANGQPDGEPVPGETRQTVASIHDLRVLDSACGSGSFLIYAYEVLAKFYQLEIERLEAERDRLVRDMAARFTEITLDDRIAAQRVEDELIRLRNYPRIILEQHLYGVDLDPQAAEIAVVNLMMRALERRVAAEKRLPLILNQNVKVGNSLIGLRPGDERLTPYRAEIAQLIRLRQLLHTDPDKPEPGAWDALERERVRQQTETIDDDWLRDLAKSHLKHGRRTLELEDTHPTYAATLARTEALRQQINSEHFAAHFSDVERARPFHWGIEFPEAFYDEHGDLLPNPGFTIIFGNPPWEIVKPDLREFYAQFDARIESQFNRQQVEQRIEELKAEDPRRERDFEAQVKLIEEGANYYRASSDYTRQGRGDTATHKLFTERSWLLLKDGGRLGYVVPAGIYRDLGAKDLREMLLGEGHIQYVFSFSNERGFFPGVHHDFRFTLIGAQKGVEDEGFWSTFRFNPRVAISPETLPKFLGNPSNLIYMRNSSLTRLNPDSLSIMEFQSREDYEITEKMYREFPLLGEELQDTWNLTFRRELDMTNDRDLFNRSRRGLPLYEGKMIHQFDAFFAEPSYWVEEVSAIERLANRSGTDYREYRIAYREISNATNQRTLIASFLPRNIFCNHKLFVSTGLELDKGMFVLALLNSYVLDYVVRPRVNTSVSLYMVKQLPIPRLTAGHPAFDALVERAARLVCTRAEFADLWRAVMGGEWPGVPHPPAPSPSDREGEQDGNVEAQVPSPLVERGRFAGGEVSLWPVVSPAERQRLRDEIDAIVAHLYGLSRAEFEHILRTFPLVFPNTAEGEAKLSALLAMYDALAAGQ